MSGFEYVALDGGPVHPVVSITNRVFAAAGLTVMGLTALAASSLSNHDESQTPFKPTLGLASVLVKPGPPSILQIFSPLSSSSSSSPSCLFLYGTDTPKEFAELASTFEEAYVYGAAQQKGSLAHPTGRDEDVLKGRLLCWTPPTPRALSEILQDPNKWPQKGSLGVVSAVVKDGGAKQAYWLCQPPVSRSAKLQQLVQQLRHDLPTLFAKDISYDIYTKDVVFKDPVNSFKGKFSYRIIFWTLRFHGNLFFTDLAFDLHDVTAPDEQTILAFWTVRGRLRLPYDTRMFFNGNSTYKLNSDNLIYEHIDRWDRGPGAILKQFLPNQPKPDRVSS
eukprot:gb/GEZN01012780.1/.p1 GENE.gb/GEZN01012780.1/~~gb/GEZN01012780.1/.p1  ORF type:complete len:334 (-),score=54.09 gb/GEZN01012780.1/:13-1014(-)